MKIIKPQIYLRQGQLSYKNRKKLYRKIKRYYIKTFNKYIKIKGNLTYKNIKIKLKLLSIFNNNNIYFKNFVF